LFRPPKKKPKAPSALLSSLAHDGANLAKVWDKMKLPHTSSVSGPICKNATNADKENFASRYGGILDDKEIQVLELPSQKPGAQVLFH